MRARNIKPGVFKNEILGGADPLLTILFEGLWCMADREGRLEDRPLRVCAEVFPYRRAVTEKRADAMLTWLHDQGFITRYKVLGKGYIQIIEFLKHQRPHKNEAHSVIQPLSSLDDVPRSQASTTKVASGSDLTRTPLRSDSGFLIPDSLIADCSTSGQGPASAIAEVWRDVARCDTEAMTAWIDHRRIVKPPGLREHEQLAAAKMLAGMGPPSAQRSAVNAAIANSWNNLRITDGQQQRPGQPAQSTKADRESADRDRLEQLKASRAGRGIPNFRSPGQHESADAYETALKIAARDVRPAPKAAAK